MISLIPAAVVERANAIDIAIIAPLAEMPHRDGEDRLETVVKGAKPDTKTESLLPLDSPNWLPLKYAHQSLSQWCGDQILAAKDLNEALTDDKSPVHSMLRHRGPGPDTLVPPTFWAKFKVTWLGTLFVCDPGPPMRWSPGVYFVWGPDLEKRWPTVFGQKPATMPDEQSNSEAPRRPPGPPPTKDWPTRVTRELIRMALAGEPMPTAPEMCQWCENKLNWQPDLRQMQRLLRELL